MTTEIGPLEFWYTKSGDRRYQQELFHEGLKKHRLIRGDDATVIRQKVELQAAAWDQRWAEIQERDAIRRERERSKEAAAEQTANAQAELAALDTILATSLEIDHTVDWGKLKDHKDFHESRPVAQTAQDIHEPDPEQFKARLTLLDKVFPALRARRIEEASKRYNAALDAFKRQVEGQRQRELEFDSRLKDWEVRKQAFLASQAEDNAAIDLRRQAYEALDADAILDYCDMVLANSQYPDWMPKEWEMDYNPETRSLLVEYCLPPLDEMPRLMEVRYIQARDECTERFLSETQAKKQYDAVLYQIVLRTIRELLQADSANALDSVIFNGLVTSVDPATGHEATACILSLQAQKQEFMAINLSQVDPKMCFKSLKGIGSSKLHSLTPVAPILRIERDDRRFVSARSVAEALDDSVNLAAMNWEDFEHLVRELFERVFAKSGGDVKVTQASRDGGVDAIAFDPDPIRGGKIVIQAKRYTNVVGVGAVRDLYGTVMNEGATKGILVTTSDYGPDAYAFVKGKPLTLLNGANLLHLLREHGTHAKIDIQEARKILRP
jgi:restriction system protein